MVNCNPIDKDYIVSSQANIENTKASILHVCDKPYHKIKENLPHWKELEHFIELWTSQDQEKYIALGGAWNFAEQCIQTAV